MAAPAEGPCPLAPAPDGMGGDAPAAAAAAGVRAVPHARGGVPGLARPAEAGEGLGRVPGAPARRVAAVQARLRPGPGDHGAGGAARAAAADEARESGG